MKKMLISSSIIMATGVILIGITYSYFTQSVTMDGNTISTGGAADILEISSNGVDWSEAIPGLVKEDIFPGFEESLDAFLRNISDNANAEITPYLKENCQEACAGECSGGGWEECGECNQKCNDLFNGGLEMKITEVTNSSENDLTEGYHFLSEYQSGMWCEGVDIYGNCMSYGNPPVIKTIVFGGQTQFKVYYRLLETEEDQTNLADGKIKFDTEFRGRQVAP